MAEPARIGVLGMTAEELDLHRRAHPAPEGRQVAWTALGPLPAREEIPRQAVEGLDVLVVRLTGVTQADAVERLALSLPRPVDGLRSRIGLLLLVPDAEAPVDWLTRARPELPALLDRQLRFHEVFGDEAWLERSLTWLEVVVEERDFEPLGDWLEEHPHAANRAIARIDAFLDRHPDGQRTAELRAERRRRHQRQRARRMRWPIGIAASLLILLVGWSGCEYIEDGRRFEHARTFEGEDIAQRWLAIDAYAQYLARSGWYSPAARTRLAGERIPALMLALLRDTREVAADDLERYVALVDRLGADYPGAATEGERERLRGALRLRIAIREFDATFAAFDEPAADLGALEKTWDAYAAREGALPADPAILRRYRALLSRRLHELDARRWAATRKEARRFQDPVQRQAIYRRYLTESKNPRHAGEAQAAIRAEQLRIDRQLWQALQARLAQEKKLPLIRRIELVEQFISIHPRNPRLDAARRELGRLRTALDDADWRGTLALQRKLGRQYLKRMSALLAHQERMLEQKCSHGSELARLLPALRKQADHQRYQRLKQWFTRDPDAAPEIARRFAIYLREFPNGAHVATARAFIAWWAGVRKAATYRLAITSARIDKSKVSTGENTPEPFVVLDSAGQKVRTKPISSWSPTWNTVVRLRWKPGQELVLRVYDKDVRYDDYLFTIRLSGLMSLAKFRGTLRHADGHQLTVSSSLPLPELP